MALDLDRTMFYGDLACLDAGLMEWQREWREDGTLASDIIGVPDWMNEQDEADKVRKMMHNNNYDGIKRWWKDYLLEAQADRGF